MPYYIAILYYFSIQLLLLSLFICTTMFYCFIKFLDSTTQFPTIALFSPTRPHWAELVIESPCPDVCLSVFAIGYSFFPGLSLALRSHNQFQASHWASLPPSLGNLETFKLRNSVTRKVGNLETW